MAKVEEYSLMKDVVEHLRRQRNLVFSEPHDISGGKQVDLRLAVAPLEPKFKPKDLDEIAKKIKRSVGSKTTQFWPYDDNGTEVRVPSLTFTCLVAKSVRIGTESISIIDPDAARRIGIVDITAEAIDRIDYITIGLNLGVFPSSQLMEQYIDKAIDPQKHRIRSQYDQPYFFIPRQVDRPNGSRPN